MVRDSDFKHWFDKGLKAPLVLATWLFIGPIVLLGFILEKTGLWSEKRPKK